VATTTVKSKFAIMNVIGAVAIPTTGTQTFHCRKRASVTVVATHFSVSPFQQEACLRLVIKHPIIPGNRVVARLTIIREHPFVRVILNMTTCACALGIVKNLCLVTGSALELVMFTQQRKQGQAVVEERYSRPRRLNMTGRTIRTLRAIVHVIVDMAGIARSADRHLKYWLYMAVFADNRLMCSV